MVDVAELGLKVVTDQAGDARLVLDDLTAAAGRAEDATQDLTAASAKLDSSVGKASAAAGKAAHGVGKVGIASKVAGGNARMLSMQLSQVAQQASATGNVTQALAIQAADIGLAFGTVGTVVGILATIALPSLIAAFSSAEAEAMKFSDAMDRLGEVQAGLEASTETLSTSLVGLYQKYGVYALAVREATLALVEHQIAESKIALGETLIEATSLIERYSEAAGRGIVNMAKELGVTVGEAQELRESFANLRDAISFEDRVTALREIERALKAAGVSSEQLPVELRKALKEGNEAAIAMAGLRNVTLNAAEAAKRLGASVPGAGWLSGAIGDANSLGAALWRAVQAKSALFDQTYGQTTGSGAWYAGMTAEQILPPKLFPGLEPPKATKGAAGGGGGADNTRLDSLVQELQTEREILEAWYAESMALLQASSDAELEAIGGRNEAKLRLEQQYQERLRELRSGYEGTALQQASTFFGEMADAMQGGNEKMLKAARIFGAAQSLINSYIAYTEVLKDPLLPWFARIPAAAGVLAAGMNMVNAIKGGGKGGAAASASKATTPAMQQASPVNVSIQGVNPASLYTGQQMIDLTTAVQKELKNRGVLFSYI